MQEQLFTVEGMDQFIPADRSVPRVREDFNGCLSRMDTHFDTALNRSAAIVFEAAIKQMTVNPLIGAGKTWPVFECLYYSEDVSSLAHFILPLYMIKTS